MRSLKRGELLQYRVDALEGGQTVGLVWATLKSWVVVSIWPVVMFTCWNVSAVSVALTER